MMVALGSSRDIEPIGYIHIHREKEGGRRGKGEIYFKEMTDMSIVAGNSKIHKLPGWTFR